MGKSEMLGVWLRSEMLGVWLRYRVCSFGANLLHLGNVGKRVSRRFLGLQLFHVKHGRGRKAKKCSHFFIC